MFSINRCSVKSTGELIQSFQLYKALIPEFLKNFQSSSRPENLLKTFLPLNGLGRIWALGIKLMRLVKIAFNRLYIPGILAILTGWHA